MEKIKKEEMCDVTSRLKELSQLMSSYSKMDDYFGSSVALSADGLVAMIGAAYEDTKADKAGKVYTYRRNSIDEEWQEVNQLVASDGEEDNFFGSSVALSANGLVAMVGAHGKDTEVCMTGKVYTYKRDSIDVAWQEVNQLTASDGKEDDYFGRAVALSANGLVAIVGAYGDDTKACDAGKVYTYKRNSIDADWEEASQLTASDGEEDDRFGVSTAISADGLVAIVGAYGESTEIIGAGKVYTYKRDSIDSDWIEVSQLTASDIDEYAYFGFSVALSADGLVAIVGAYGESTEASDAGKVYTYKRDSIDSDWIEVSQLTASDIDEYVYFGRSVALSSDGLVAMIGAFHKNAKIDDIGKVYIYGRSSINVAWEEVSQLTSSDVEKKNDGFSWY